MRFRVAQLDGTNATEVVQETGNLVVGGILGELGMRDKEVGLADMGHEQVVSQKQDNNRCLGIGVLSQNRCPESRKKSGSEGDNRRLWRRRQGRDVLAMH